jgi:hypothetical protein
MSNKFRKLIKRNNMVNTSTDEFSVSSRMPFPIRRVDYKVLLRLMKVLEGLPAGSSFPIKSEHAYAVRKLARDYYPEYKLSVWNLGDSHRVFRVA